MIQCRIYFPDVSGYFSDDFYEVDLGMTITREFGETLDSAQLSISNVPASRRIGGYIKPYSFAYLELDDGTGTKGYLFLVDTILESSGLMVNDDVLYYSYEVTLMSQTKLLEKIQLPNRTITHSLVDGQKTINQVMAELFDQYMPKIKAYDRELGTWKYEPIISVDTSTTDFERFNVPCADISMSDPTLRQAITSLMVQVHCLPKVEDMALGYIDLDAKPDEINANGIDERQESNASDSFVTKLVTSPTQVLDDGNEVVCETLGFRDRGSVFLKSDSNLKLETRFPIYSITDAKLRYYHSLSLNMKVGKVQHIKGNFIATPNFSNDVDTGNPTLFVDWTGAGNSDLGSHTIGGTIFQIDASRGQWKVRNSIALPTTTFSVEQQRGSVRVLAKALTDIFTYPSSGDSDFNYVFTLARVRIDNGDELFISDTASGFPWQPLTYLLSADTALNKAVSNTSVAGLYQKTITPLFAESSARALKDTDFLKMGSVSTIEELSRYIYGTVSYSIGSREITGFSQKYTKTSGWFNSSFTYIENIVNTVFNIDKEGEKMPTPATFTNEENPYFSEAFANSDISVSVSLTYNDRPAIISPWETLATIGSGYPFIFFDISYIPLTDARVCFPKKDRHPFELEQLDSSENGLVASRSFGLSESEKIARLGQPVLSAHKRVYSLGEYEGLGDGLNRLIKGATSLYTTFSETIKANGEALDISYTASRDYVLKNYFTSVVTKYRAYENVDYSKSVLRKENYLVYLDLETYYFNGDDHVWFGSYLKPESTKSMMGFIDAPFYSEDVKRGYVTSFLQDANGRTMLGELSTLCGETRVVFTHRDFDNASMGLYMTKDATLTTGGYANFPEGQPQSWYSNDGYTKSIYLGFSQPMGYYQGTEFVDITSPNLGRELQVSAPTLYPLLRNELYDFRETLDGFYWFRDRERKERLRVGKDNAELMQYSIQFEYLSHDPRVRIFEGFARLCSAVGKPIRDRGNTYYIFFHSAEPRGYMATRDDSYFGEMVLHNLSGGHVLGSPIAKGDGSSGHASFIIDWDFIFKNKGERFTATAIEVNANNEKRLTDLISIERSSKSGREEWYLNLNDTNDEGVYDTEDSRGNIWSRRFRIKRNTNKREVEAL